MASSPRTTGRAAPRAALVALAALASSVALLALGAPRAAAQGSVTAVSWNLESGGSRIGRISERVRSFQGVDLWGFSEVLNADWAQQLEAAAEDGEGGADFRRIVGATGGVDRLAIVYNATRFELVGQQELTHLNIGGNVRAPLVARLRERSTGRELLFMVNHLYRSNEAARHQQAAGLNQWARSQTLPVIAVGDYNFDWDVQGGDANHDAGYDRMTAGGVFRWVRPATLVPSQCSTRYASVLDFVFVSAAAQQWPATSDILVAPGDCPDDDLTPDHRPVRAVFALGGTAPPPPPAPPAAVTRAQLLERLQAVEAEVRRLRELIERLP